MDYATLNRLIALIYDAGMDRDLWPQVVETVRDAIGAEVAILFQRDIGMRLTVNKISAVSGWTAAGLAPYAAHYGNLDIRSPYVAAVPVGSVFADDRQMAFTEVERSEIFQDYFRPLGLSHGVAIPLFRELNRQGVFSSHRAPAQGAFPENAILLLEALAPHFVRALQLQRQIQRAEFMSGGLKLVLDHFPTAVFLLDEASRLQHMNTSAIELLARPGQPFQITQGRLRTKDATSNAQLVRCIVQAAGLASGRTSEPVPFCGFTAMAAVLQ